MLNLIEAAFSMTHPALVRGDMHPLLTALSLFEGLTTLATLGHGRAFD